MSAASRLAALLSEAISIETYARPEDRDLEREKLAEWHGFLERSFPLVHARCTRTILDEYALTFCLPASCTPIDDPVLITAHYDVVPVNAARWTRNPFGGEIADGCVWGRGAIDDKLSHLAVLEALETKLRDGFEPRREIHLAFGGDEETGGTRGASPMAEHFRSRGVEFAFMLDEGTLVADGVLPGLAGPVAVVGTAEKGHATIQLSVQSPGGHAAHPARLTAADRLSRAMAAIARRRFPVRITPPARTFIRALGSQTRGFAGLLMRLFPFSAPVVVPLLAANPATDALLRDTRAATIVTAANAPNVVADEASALYNVRLLPGTTVESVVLRLDRITRRYGVRAKLTDRPDNLPAPPESPATGEGYSEVVVAIRAVWRNVPVLPYLFTMTTDSRHYSDVARRTYRFLPIQLRPGEIDSIHGADEHVSIDNIQRALAFYRHFLALCGGEEP